MAGLGRVQQRFNAAVVGALAALVAFARGGSKAEEDHARAVGGHPILAKLIKSSNPNANTPGRKYAGYCSGRNETNKRYWKLAENRRTM